MKYKDNITPKNPACQEQNQRYPKKLRLDEWEQRKFIYRGNQENLEYDLSLLTPTDKAVLTHILTLRANGMPCYSSQEYMANKIGVTRETVNRSTQKLSRIGFIDKYTRGPENGYINGMKIPLASSENKKQKSCVYKVISDLLDSRKWLDLKTYLPVLGKFILFTQLITPLLGTCPPEFYTPKFRNRHFKQNITGYNVNNINKYINIKKRNDSGVGLRSLGSLLGKQTPNTPQREQISPTSFDRGIRFETPEDTKSFIQGLVFNANLQERKKVEESIVQQPTGKPGDVVHTELHLTAAGKAAIARYPEQVQTDIERYIFQKQPSIYRKNVTQLSLFKQYIRLGDEMMTKRNRGWKSFDYDRFSTPFVYEVDLPNKK